MSGAICFQDLVTFQFTQDILVSISKKISKHIFPLSLLTVSIDFKDEINTYLLLPQNVILKTSTTISFKLLTIFFLKIKIRQHFLRGENCASCKEQLITSILSIPSSLPTRKKLNSWRYKSSERWIALSFPNIMILRSGSGIRLY